MTEFIVTVALVAIGTIAATTLFGDNVRALFGVSADSLAAQESGNRGAKAGKINRGMKDFANSSGGGAGPAAPQASGFIKP
jgi:hypothetical protein